MQRILKYHLLLGTLATSTTDPATAANLKAAHESMLDVADYINEVKRDSEHLQVIQEIQANITDMSAAGSSSSSDLKFYGRMRKDGELKVGGTYTTQ